MQKLLKNDQLHQLLANGAASATAIAKDGNTPDHWPVVKLFNPCGAATWLLSELDTDLDTAYGLCDLGMGSPELGYVSLTELATVKLRFGLKIERDQHWTAKGPMSSYAEKARTEGRIAA